MRENIHKTAAVVVSVFFNDSATRVICAPECGGSHRLQLFSSDDRSRASNYCWSDQVIVRNEEACVFLEVEQSGIVNPCRIAGKLLPIALSSWLCNEDIGRSVPISRNATLIQLVNTAQLKPATRKLLQYENLESDIRRLLPLGCITRYYLFPVLADTAPPFGMEKFFPVIEAIRQSLA